MYNLENHRRPLPSRRGAAAAPARCLAADLAAQRASLVGFLFGREDVIPDMFRALRAEWPDAAKAVPHFVHYLDRHIELDDGHHSVLARELLDAFAAADPASLQRARASGRRAIAARIALWDDVLRRVSPRPAAAPAP